VDLNEMLALARLKWAKLTGRISLVFVRLTPMDHTGGVDCGSRFLLEWSGFIQNSRLSPWSFFLLSLYLFFIDVMYFVSYVSLIIYTLCPLYSVSSTFTKPDLSFLTYKQPYPQPRKCPDQWFLALFFTLYLG
jgi:hypothetical protein